ncbi:Sensor protein ZraS [Rubripirellula lacrimiformis]|uniref:histidine kinase n=1 Tax=Rubripirellula lacrimiformis TaxID=1930273 RepID=A0A517NKF5_9BACT|nr:ATP-binding protein [Rubripirellula lacrimiformis]QDT07625.1 Sensor protein ZraS [Rubripirellula lacrimiformis]
MSKQPNAAPNINEQQLHIQQLKGELRRLQSMAALGELTGTATHEFNNVLMTIINYARLGIRNKDEPSRDKALSKILEASERAAKITNTILAQAKNRSESFEPTQLGEIIDSSMMLLEREMRNYRIAVETEIDPATPAVQASGNQIGRVLLNLLINARQAIVEGGTILVRLAPSSEAGWVELTVRDSGSGIPQESLPRIFDSFYSTKSGPDESGKGGTGLGLAACKEIIDAHDGRIRVESSVGVGTAFIIRLPVAVSAQAAA